MAIYVLQPEHQAKFPEWRDKWIKNALRTGLYSPEERLRFREAVKGLYQAANLTPPPDNRIIFVPSPFVARFAAGAASWIWYQRKNTPATFAATSDAAFAATRDGTHATTYAACDATYAATCDATNTVTSTANTATRDATREATYVATDDATNAATHDATNTATRDATREATYEATYVATRDATNVTTYDATRATTKDATIAATNDATIAATNDATNAATYAATNAATRAITSAATATTWYSLSCSISDLADLVKNLAGEPALQCATNAQSMLNGGNQWSGWVAHLSFFRHIAKLDLDYSKWHYYEILAEAGPRYMHSEFCLISERPIKLLIDEKNRPHCEDGPFCQWSDGSKLYALHGNYIPQRLIEHPESITVDNMGVNNSNIFELCQTDRFLSILVDKIPKERWAELLSNLQASKHDKLLKILKSKLKESTPK